MISSSSWCRMWPTPRAAGKILAKVAEKKGWAVTGMEIYPTGTSDFSMA